MKNKNLKKLISMGYKMGMKALPFCAMAMVVINANSTTCWLNGQPEPPAALRKYRKF